MLRRSAFLAAAFATAALGHAQTPPPAEVKPPATPAAQAPATPPVQKPAVPAPDKPKTIDDLTKDFTKQEGLLTVYRQSKGLFETIYLEVPEAKLGKLMLLQVTSASGLGDTQASWVFHGMPIADLPIRLVPQGESKLQLVSPNLGHRANNPESLRTIKRSFPDALLDTFEIKARQPERKSVLIEVSSFFRSDVGELSTAINMPGYGGMALAGGNVDTIKDFPDNLVVRTVYNVNRMGMPLGPKVVQWAVSFNLSELPETGYRPRLGDPRIGYFTVSYDDLTDQSRRDPTVNMIERWNLVKKDPKAALSEPVKPILFWIDNATPKEYRDAVRKGALMYNQAFEKVGFKDAIVVRQMPDDADWDIADLRYNVIRWTTGMPFAIALMRANPVTGEILNASLNMDGIFAAGAKFDFEHELDPGTYARPAMRPDKETMDALRARWGDRLCELVTGGARDHANGLEALDAMSPTMSPEERERFIQQYITEVVAHEMGHCMGLRHNFAASTEFGPADLSDPTTVAAHGIGGTVMDYNPYNVFALGHKGVDYYSQHVGAYDDWAIDYGYRPLPAATMEGELSALRGIASQSGLPGHQYQSDGSADDFDPYVVRFDLGREPLDRLEREAALGRKMRLMARRKLVPGTSYYEFTQSYTRGLSAQLQAVIDSTLYLGGGRLGSSYIGDKGGAHPYTPVPAAQQRRALALVVSNLLADGSLDVKREDLARLSFNPNAPGNEAYGRSRLFPMRDEIVALQSMALGVLFWPDSLDRMQSNEFRVGPKGDTLTMAELFRTANAAVWSELDAKKPISDLRRELQRAHLNNLCALALGQVRGAPADAKTLALANLRSLRNRIAAALPTASPEYTKPHLQESLTRIDRVLDAKIMVAR